MRRTIRLSQLLTMLDQQRADVNDLDPLVLLDVWDKDNKRPAIHGIKRVDHDDVFLFIVPYDSEYKD